MHDLCADEDKASQREEEPGGTESVCVALRCVAGAELSQSIERLSSELSGFRHFHPWRLGGGTLETCTGTRLHIRAE